MFQTDMHRLTTFHNVRVNPSNLPDEIKKGFPEYQEVLTRMLSLDPTKRPSAQELLQMPLFAKKSKRDLMLEIEDRDKQIKEMQKKVKTKCFDYWKMEEMEKQIAASNH